MDWKHGIATAWLEAVRRGCRIEFEYILFSYLKSLPKEMVPEASNITELEGHQGNKAQA